MLRHHFCDGLKGLDCMGLTEDAMKRIILNSITSNQQLSYEEMKSMHVRII